MSWTMPVEGTACFFAILPILSVLLLLLLPALNTLWLLLQHFITPWIQGQSVTDGGHTVRREVTCPWILKHCHHQACPTRCDLQQPGVTQHMGKHAGKPMCCRLCVQHVSTDTEVNERPRACSFSLVIVGIHDDRHVYWACLCSCPWFPQRPSLNYARVVTSGSLHQWYLGITLPTLPKHPPRLSRTSAS
jgi:hypothetical protein